MDVIKRNPSFKQIQSKLKANLRPFYPWLNLCIYRIACIFQAIISEKRGAIGFTQDSVYSLTVSNRSDKGLTLETSAFLLFTVSTQLLTLNYSLTVSSLFCFYQKDFAKNYDQT